MDVLSMLLHCQYMAHTYKPELPVLRQNRLLHMNQLQQLEILHLLRLSDATDEKNCHFDWNPMKRKPAN